MSKEKENKEFPKVLENRLKENSEKSRSGITITIGEPCPVCEGKVGKDEDCDGCSGTGIFTKALTIEEFKELIQE